MGPFEIAIDNWSVLYLPAGATVPLLNGGMSGMPPGDIDSVLNDRPHLRRAVVRLLHRPSPESYIVLHWSDGTDLAVLDRRVAAGEASSADFSGAVATEIRQVTCHSCKCAHTVLAVDTGRALFGRTQQARLVAHKFVPNCPACGSPWTILAVEVLIAGQRSGVR